MATPFKVGDKVQVKDTAYPARYRGMLGFIKQNVSAEIYEVRFDHMAATRFYRNELTEVEDTSPAAPYKVGDRVKVIRPGLANKDCQGTICEIQGDPRVPLYRVKMAPGAKYKGPPAGLHYTGAELEPVPAAPFKVGDRVRILQDNRAPKEYVGQTGEIVEKLEPACKDSTWRVKFNDGARWYYQESHMELVPTTPYKVGDRVRILKPNGAPIKLVGQIGTVQVAGQDDTLYVQFEDGKCWYYNFTDVELVAFKVGDRVRVISKRQTSIDNIPKREGLTINIGDLGTVVGTREAPNKGFMLTGTECDISVLMDHDPAQQPGMAPSYCFEPTLLPKEPASMTPPVTDLNHTQALATLEVGDTVRITGTAPSYVRGWLNCWNKEMDAYVGQVGVVRSKASTGVRLSICHDFHFPAFVLEKVPHGTPDNVVSTELSTSCTSTSTSTLPKDTTMLNAAKIEHRTYLTLPGATAPMNVKELTNDQLLNGIKTCEDEVERLKALKARSKFVAKQIKDLQAGIDQMVEILDARVVEDDEPKAKAK